MNSDNSFRCAFVYSQIFDRAKHDGTACAPVFLYVSRLCIHGRVGSQRLASGNAPRICAGYPSEIEIGYVTFIILIHQIKFDLPLQMMVLLWAVNPLVCISGKRNHHILDILFLEFMLANAIKIHIQHWIRTRGRLGSPCAQQRDLYKPQKTKQEE